MSAGSKDKIKSFFFLSLLLILAWGMLIVVLSIIGFVVVPMGEEGQTVILQVSRAAIALTAVALWIYVWKRLAEWFFYDVLLPAS